jgi:hypothetical protein
VIQKVSRCRNLGDDHSILVEFVSESNDDSWFFDDGSSWLSIGRRLRSSIVVTQTRHGCMIWGSKKHEDDIRY